MRGYIVGYDADTNIIEIRLKIVPDSIPLNTEVEINEVKP
jgi:hypothetical protein